MSVSLLLSMATSEYDERPAVGRLADPTSYARLARLAAGGAAVLLEAGARTVVFVGVNSPAVPVTLFASAHAGVAFVPLNYRLSAAALHQLIGTLDAPVVIADAAYLELLDGAAPLVLAAEDWLGRCAASEPADEVTVDDDAAAVILFTSGTTSAPKGVVLRHGNLLAYVLGTVEFGSAGPHDAALISVPPYHIAGIGTVLTNVYAGRRMVYLPTFDPEQWLSLVRAESVTNTMLVPTMLARIVDHLNGAPAQTPTLRSLAYGGSRTAPSVVEKALACFPETGFVNAYGLTETSSTIAVLGPDDHRAAFAATEPGLRRRLASVGQLVPSIEGQVRDDAGRVLGPNAYGDLWVRGPQVSGEYLGLGSALDDHGWFPTRDRAMIDDDGYVYIEGRVDDTIIRGGENIAPAEIEDVLAAHPGVQSVAVVGVPDPQWGECLTAVVVRRAGAAVTGEELRSWVRERLRGSRTPDSVKFWRDLPTTPTGKLIRREIVSALALEENPSANTRHAAST